MLSYAIPRGVVVVVGVVGVAVVVSSKSMGTFYFFLGKPRGKPELLFFPEFLIGNLVVFKLLLLLLEELRNLAKTLGFQRIPERAC